MISTSQPRSGVMRRHGPMWDGRCFALVPTRQARQLHGASSPHAMTIYYIGSTACTQRQERRWTNALTYEMGPGWSSIQGNPVGQRPMRVERTGMVQVLLVRWRKRVGTGRRG